MLKYASILVYLFLFYQAGKFPFVVHELNEQGEAHSVIFWTYMPTSDQGGSRDTHKTKRAYAISKIKVIKILSNKEKGVYRVVLITMVSTVRQSKLV